MKHYIIIKWNKEVTDKALIAGKVRELYSSAVDIHGVEHVTIKENITPRDNRFDLMIVIDMAEDALQNWDESSLHKQWKSEYSPLIEKKAIFDSTDRSEERTVEKKNSLFW